MSTFFQWLIDTFRDIKFWFRVEPWEKGVRVRALTKGSKTMVVGAGLHWKIPMLDEVYMVNTRLRIAPASTQTISTKDAKVVTLGITIGFSIIDPLQAMNTYQDPESSVSVLAHNYSADYVASRTLEEVQLPELEVFVEEGLKETPDNGINIEFVKVTNFVHSSPARTIRLVQDDLIVDHSVDPADKAKWQPNVMQW